MEVIEGDISSSPHSFSRGDSTCTTQLVARLVNEANELAEAGKRQSARALYEMCLEKEPDNAMVLANFALLASEELEEKMADKEDPDEVERARRGAISLYLKALERMKTWFQGHYNVANLYAEGSPEEESKAIMHYKEAIALSNGDADCCNNIAIVLHRAGHLAEAIEFAKKAVRLDKDSEPFCLNLAELYNEAGDDKRAVFFAKKCKHNRNAILLLGSIYCRNKDFANAEAVFKNLAKAEPLDLPSVIRCYSLQTMLGKHAEATEMMHQAAMSYSKSHPDDHMGIKTLQYFAGIDFSDQKGEGEELNSPNAPAAEACLLHMSLSNAEFLAHKCLVFDRLKEANLEYLCPPTHTCSSGDELREILSKAPPGSLWFVKDPMMQRGQGIDIVLAPNSKETDFAHRFAIEGKRICLQQAVEPLLLNDRKFGLRVHVLLFQSSNSCLECFMAQDAILTKCGRPYAHNETSKLTQITCTSIQRAEPGFKRDLVKGPASELWDGFQQCLPKLEESLLAIVKAVAPKLIEVHGEPKDVKRMQLFGLDFCIDKDERPIFIEANISPQFQDSKALQSLQQTIAIPLLSFVKALKHGTNEQSSGWKHLGQISSCPSETRPNS